MKPFAILLASVCLLPAEPLVWRIDSSHSAAQFAVKHMMVSTVRGTMGKVSGTVTYDSANPNASKVEAVIDVAGLNTNDAKRDAHLRSADFFDVEKFPTMTFVSKKVEGSGGKLKATGDLTIHGVTKEVVLDIDGPMPPIKGQNNSMRSGAAATAKINRKDFGINWSRNLDSGGVVVSDEVTVTIDVELVHAPPRQ